MTGVWSFSGPGLRRWPDAAAGAARAAAPAALTGYKIQLLYKEGDTVGDPGIRTGSGTLSIGALNDNGNLVFVTTTSSGGSALIFRRAVSSRPSLSPERMLPEGSGPAALASSYRISMNQAGNFIFDAEPDGEFCRWRQLPVGCRDPEGHPAGAARDAGRRRSDLRARRRLVSPGNHERRRGRLHGQREERVGPAP